MNGQPKIIFTLPGGETRKYSVQMDSIRIGRAPDNTVVLEDGSMSSHHAVLHRRESGYELLDLGSTNGIEFEGQRVMSHDLKHGQELKIGSVAMRFEWPGQPGLEVAEPDRGESPEPERGGTGEEDAGSGQEETGEEDGKPKEGRNRRSFSLSGKGCMASVGLFTLTLLAPVAGMHLRHWKETGRILVLEMLNLPVANSTSQN